MASKDFYSRIRRLFASGTIVRVLGKNKIQVLDTDDHQRHPRSKYRGRHGYGISSNASIYGNNRQQSLAYLTNRRDLFRDYESMDNDAIIASALDIYADESTKKDEFGEILTITSSNEEIKEILYNLFYNILNVEFNLWSWTRSVCKYGDFFLSLDVHEKVGIKNVLPLSAYEIIREEGFDPDNPMDTRFIYDGAYGKKEFDNYEVAHFRLLNDSNFIPYGKSVIENARRAWKQSTLLEDAMLIHRIMRAPERRIFKFDIGNLNEADVPGFIERAKAQIKKVPYINPQTGDYNLKYNIQNLTEDFFLPVRGGDSGTSIENLPGLEYQTMEDIEYVQKRLMAALKIPRAYLGYEEDTSGKSLLSAEDFRFAGSIARVQNTMAAEFYKIASVHLYALGYDDERLDDFSIELTTNSTIYEQEKVRIWQEKIRTAQDARDNKMLSEDWIYDKIYKLSEDDIKKQRDAVVKDSERKFRIEQIENEGNDPAKSGRRAQDGPEDGSSDGVGGFANEPGDDDSEIDYDAPEFKKGGRPRDNQTKYGTDKHPMGRDPLGNKTNRPSTSQNEMRQLVQSMKSKRSILTEKDTTKPQTMLDETNIIE